MLNLKIFLFVCVVGCVLAAMDDPITVVPPEDEGCRRFDETYHQSLDLIQKLHNKNCERE